MNFDLETAVPVLARTPQVLNALLRGLPPAWEAGREGPDTWNPYDVVGHLIHGERTDWMPRVEHLLSHGEAVPFPAFDRFAQFQASSGQSLAQLLDTFRELRGESLSRLAALRLTANDLERIGQHPEFGRVTLGHTWPRGWCTTSTTLFKSRESWAANTAMPLGRGGSTCVSSATLDLASLLELSQRSR